MITVALQFCVSGIKCMKYMGWMVVCGGVSAAEGEVEWKVRGAVESLAGTGGICFLILPLLFMQ